MSVENDGNHNGRNGEEESMVRAELAPQGHDQRRLPLTDQRGREAPNSIAVIRFAEPRNRTADAAAILDLITQPHAREHIGRIHAEKNPDELEPNDVRDYFKKNPNFYPLLAVIPDGSRALGTLTLAVDRRRHAARFIMLVVDGDSERQGIGRKLVRKGSALVFAPDPEGFGFGYEDAGTMVGLAGRRDVLPASSRLLQAEGFLTEGDSIPNGGDSWNGKAYVDREVQQLRLVRARYMRLNRNNMRQDALHVRSNQGLPPLQRPRG